MERHADMHGQSRLQKRGSVYYFRAMIPKDLHVLYGRKEIVYSLKTKDAREARRLARQASVTLDAEFEARRNQRPPDRPRTLSVLDDATIRGLCDTWRHECLSGDVWSRAQGLSDAEFEESRARREETLTTLREILAKGRLEKITPALQQFLALVNIDFCGDQESLRKLAWAFLETAIETHKAIMQRDDGEVVPTPPAPRPIGTQAPTVASNASDTGVTFAKCFEIWKVAVSNRPSKTLTDFKSVMDDFIARVGDKPVAQYTPEDAYDYADHIRKRDDSEPETIEKKLSHLRAIYFAAKRRLRNLPENPFSRLVITKERDKKPARLSLNRQDLERIFAAPIYRARKRPKGGAGEAAVWLPLLALFTGARLEELGQLRLADVGCERGIHYLHITDLTDDDDVEEDGSLDRQAIPPEKRLKNAQSRRKVPIHAELIRAGFLRYVEQMRNQGSSLLFPLLKVDCHGKITGNFSKWWGRYRRKHIGIKSRLKPFHSLRHAFRDACREADIGEERSDALMGHLRTEKAGRGYGHGFSLKALYRAVNRIHYPGVVIPVIIEPNDARD